METATPDQNPYTGPPEGDATDHTAPTARQRFGVAAIIGMVAATLGWLLALLPLYVWADTFVSHVYGMGFFINAIGFAGVLTLVGSLIGLFVSLRAGKKKLAARLYIIPSLAWQGFVGVMIAWVILILVNQNGS